MIANAAFLAGLTTFVLAGLAGRRAELSGAVQGRHLPDVRPAYRGRPSLLVFVNLVGTYYLIARWLFLRDAGRKLTHIDRQLRSAPGLHDDLRRHFQKKPR